MDLQTRKLNLIAYLAQLQDEVFFTKIEHYIIEKFEVENQLDFIPFTLDEFVKRIEKSEKDFKNGKIKSQEELEKIAFNW